MRQLSRSSELDNVFSVEDKLNYYENLRDSSGQINPRWNIPKLRDKLKPILSEMSHGECAFCGVKIGNKDFAIEHFLPKERFPYLSYCVDNYLPACKKCNQSLKRVFFPASLEPVQNKLADKALFGKMDGIIPYEPSEILPTVLDRIIEPTYDIIEEHLHFNPDTTCYIAMTEIGERTNEMFFRHSEVVSKLQQLSTQIFKMINEGSTKDTILGWGELYGHSFYIEQLYNYWSDIID